MCFVGIKVTYNLKNPTGYRVIRNKVMVRCSNCTVPTFEPLNENALYGVVTNAFIMGGGDGYGVLRDHAIAKLEYSKSTYHFINLMIHCFSGLI